MSEKQLTEADLYVGRQVEGQQKDYKTTSRRYLDFSPFEDRLKHVNKVRNQTIGQMVIEADVASIQKHVQDGDLTYEDLTLFYIKRIHDLDDKKLNAVMQLNPDAIITARSQDVLRKQGTLLGPLQGIPVLLKDNIGTGDKMYNTAGAKVLETSSCDRDSFIAKKLREAGAIILGKANMSEWANFMSEDSLNGYSTLGGQTHNPYGHYDVGGSSSGSAVAVAANFVPLAIGTETTGSIISPASQNNVVGIKPTVGLWSRDRIIPIAHDLDTAGPIARTVQDAALLLGALVGEDEMDSFTKVNANRIKDYTSFLNKDGLQGMRIGVVTNQAITDYYRTGEQVIIDRVVNELEALGASVKEILMDDNALHIERLEVLTYEFKEDVEQYLRDIGEHAPIRTMKEITDFNEKDMSSRARFGQELIEQSRDTVVQETEHQKRVAMNVHHTSAAIDNALEDHGLDLLMSLYVNLSGVYAPARYPAITIPAGYREDGEPIGLCLVSTKFREDLLIKAAYAYEQGTKHREQP